MPHLILPVENQVRELDPKLLLACVAAERGLPALLGYRTQLDFQIASLPRGLYLSKSMTPRSIKMFRILRQLGHRIAAWDEEGLVHFAPESYYARRLSATALAEVSMLFAWGDENAELYRKYPHYTGAPIHVTGNPRGDLLRPELRGYWNAEAERLRERFGAFVLINTNFAMVNAFLPTLNLLLPGEGGDGSARTGAAAVGFSRDFVEGLAAHKRAIFDHFRSLPRLLAAAFPDVAIVVRPHPTEDPTPWQAAIAGCDRAQVVQEGNVIPWLLACRAQVHNGCTTAIEAYALDAPAVAFQPVRSERFDLALPNRLSYACSDPAELCRTLDGILAGSVGCARSRENDLLLAHHLSARTGRLASERIVDRLEASDAPARPPSSDRASGWLAARWRSFVKRQIKARVPGHRNNPGFQQHRFAGVSTDELRERVARLGGELRRFEGIEIRRVGRQVFEIRS